MIEVLHLPNNIVIVSKTYPSFLTLKEGSLFSPSLSLIVFTPPFGSPSSGGQKPQEREDVAGCAIASARVLVSSAEPVP